MRFQNPICTDDGLSWKNKTKGGANFLSPRKLVFFSQQLKKAGMDDSGVPTAGSPDVANGSTDHSNADVEIEKSQQDKPFNLELEEQNQIANALAEELKASSRHASPLDDQAFRYDAGESWDGSGPSQPPPPQQFGYGGQWFGGGGAPMRGQPSMGMQLPVNDDRLMLSRTWQIWSHFTRADFG